MECTEVSLMGGVCPNCRGVVLSPDTGARLQRNDESDFVVLSCGHCGLEFTTTSDELLFQAVPLSWFSQGNA
ncbi:MAG TPA: hypothetical protein VFU76_04415 [Terriglobales bacterium]|nr:hypothetical protein [Terriglobales bacterium]